MSDRVVAIVPAHNEAGRIAATVKSLAAFCDSVIVADDGSDDDTIDEAAGAGARVIRLSGNRGKGAALTAGVEAAGPVEIVVFADADLEASAASLESLLAPLRAGSADMAIAAPPPSGPSGFGVVETFARRGIRRCTGRTFSRPLSGQRAMRGAVLEAIELAPGFGIDVALTIDAVRAGFHVVEIPCSFTHARTGRDVAGFAHRGKQGADVAAALAPRLLRSRAQGVIVRP